MYKIYVCTKIFKLSTFTIKIFNKTRKQNFFSVNVTFKILIIITKEVAVHAIKTFATNVNSLMTLCSYKHVQ